MSGSSPAKYARPEHDISTLDPHWADRQIVEIIGTDKTVLEIGCASGHFGKYLKGRAGCKVWAVELDPRLAEIAKPHYETVLVADIQKENGTDPLKDLKFDVILCSNVLEHLTDPLKALLRLKKHIKPGGFFCIALPNIAHWKVRLGLLFGNFNYTETGILDESHLKFFTFSTAAALMREAGLQIESWTFDWDNGIPKFDGLLRRVPGAGPWFLKKFYGLFPRFFAYQFIFRAKPV